MKSVVIEDVSHGGDGVGKIDGRVVFVEGALPGEIVDVGIVLKKRDYFRAKISKIIRASEFRVKPPCRYYGLCGGCDFQHIDYSYQIKLKKRILGSVLKRIGKIEVENIEAEASKRTFNYRRRVKFQCDNKKWGFFKKASSDIIAVEECLIANEKINGYIRSKDCISKEIVESDTGLVNPKIMILDLSDIIEGLYLTYKHGAFIQVNKDINIKMVKTVVEDVKKKGIKSVFDFFGGIGNFSVPLAVLGVDVVSFDSDKRAVDSFNKNAVRLDISNRAKSIKINLNRSFAYGCKADSPRCFILDPPRAGAKNIAEYIIKNRPEYIFYISCDPATLARDLRILKDFYIINKIKLFDMFPQTHHLETLVELELR